MNRRASRLLTELSDQLELGPVDAHRAVFTVLCVRAGWPKARIGRWLGISRARVGQRIAKYERYAEDKDSFPALAEALAEAQPTVRDTQRSIGFSPDDWEDLTFAVAMVQKVQ